MNNTLPTDSAARKGFPIFSGLLAYFPAALAGIARWSKLGNEKHNPGESLHHARGKSMDHRDCIPRHLMDLADLEATLVRDTVPHHIGNPTTVAAILDEADALAWRACALSQELHEKYAGAPLAPGARLPEVERVSTDEKPTPTKDGRDYLAVPGGGAFVEPEGMDIHGALYRLKFLDMGSLPRLMKLTICDPNRLRKAKRKKIR